MDLVKKEDHVPQQEPRKPETYFLKVKNLEGKCPLRWEFDESTKDTTIKVQEGFEFEEAITNLCGASNSAIACEVVEAGASAVVLSSVGNKYNICLQALHEEKPKDATEAKLVLQANGLYLQGMRCLQRAEDSERIKQGEHYMKNGIKLLRLHNETVEALSRYRRGGEQKVVVQHVNVSHGGQAVVGGVFERGERGG